MAKTSNLSLRERLRQPLAQRSVETLLGVALALWAAGQIVFAYSPLGSVERIASMHISGWHAAITGACLLAVIARRDIPRRSASLVCLFVALFSTMVLWRKSGDVRPLFALLFIVAASGMDLVRLVRFHAVGMVIGALAVVLGTLLAKTSGESSLPYEIATCGFESPETCAAIVFGSVASIAFCARGRMARLVVPALCIVGAIGLCVVVKLPHVAILLLLLGACCVLQEQIPGIWERFGHKAHARVCVALLPVALFLIACDGRIVFNLEQTTGIYGSFVDTYGYLLLIVLGASYVCSILFGSESEHAFFELSLCALFAMLLYTAKPPIYLELNCSLLLISRLMNVNRPAISMGVNDVSR